MNVKWVFGLIIVIVIGGILVIKNELKKNNAALKTVAESTLAVSNAVAPDALSSPEKSLIIDHTCIALDLIPTQWIEKARTDLHITYGHTSHGSQITSGLLGLTSFKGSPYIYHSDLSAGSLDLRDKPYNYGSPLDLGQPDNKKWAEVTRTYLKNNPDINVVMWSWCGQLSDANDRYINKYLSLMQELETEFPEVTFVYMTGHLDGSGESGNLALSNMTIREFCISNNKVLYDFADIESYNPDGVYFGDKNANDACDYDSGNAKGNWAVEWQSTHIEGVDWYACTAAHSQPVNANMKAYAVWWLMARLAGWEGITAEPSAVSAMG